MNLQLDQRIALITGASQGLGYATALQLSREGALVAICSREQAHVSAAADAIHSETRRPVLGIAADVSQSADVNRLVDRVVEEYGGLDIVVTNSGGPPSSSFEETTDAMWQQSVDLLLMSAIHLVRAALPHLRQSDVPCVLAITSVAVKQPIPNLILSNSIRMAVIGLIKTLALELGGEGIRFNSILPGWTVTERVHDLMETRAERNDTTIEEEISKQAAASPLGRMATPQEFANVATFLCSPLASYLNGLMLSVDSGSYKGTF
jgi:3-oxoacyl-[acyl-carrier protein] reductase